MYKTQFEQQITRELTLLKTKKKDISKLKRDLGKLTNQKEKLLNLIINEEHIEIIKVYKEKLQSVLSQITLQNNQLELYESIDILQEEKELRKQFDLSHQDITYRDFQELSREQLKVFLII